MKIHFQDFRLYHNAGISFPICYSLASLLDMNKSSLPATNNIKDVTCKHCIKMRIKIYPWLFMSKCIEEIFLK